MHRVPRHPFLLPIGQAHNFPNTHSQRQTIVIAMSESTVQSGNETPMTQNIEYLTRHQKIMELWEAEISDYSSLEEQVHELEKQLSAKDESTIEWKMAYIQCYSELCRIMEENKQLREENKILSYLSKVMPSS